MTGVVVVRPEPGNAATIARLRAAGLDALACPLFAVTPLAWTPPDPRGIDAVLLTSANAARLGGEGLLALARLPVVAVGEASAAAARDAGLTVVVTGAGDAGDAIRLAEAHGFHRLVHLAGRDRSETARGVPAIAIYASTPLVPEPAARASWPGRTILLHSARAARRVAALAGDDRSRIGLIAIRGPVLAAAGDGWRAVRVAAHPTDRALVDSARRPLD